MGADIDRRIEQVITRPQPITLTDEELDKEHTTITTATGLVPVEAWVRYSETAIHTKAIAIAWTDRAVLVEWEVVGGGVGRAWVWASAVRKTGE